MDRIRLIASDMDATLLDGHSQLPPDFLHLVQELAVAVSGKCWIDVTNPGVTKGKAVERLSRLLDIPSGAMMAFGDTYNDIEMLEAVGYGFLMENGSLELRSRVPYLAPPNTEYGVARVLQQVLRQKGCVCPADFTKAH